MKIFSCGQNQCTTQGDFRFSSRVSRGTYIASALLDFFQKDNIVYHGLAGHFFVKDISHVLKIRLIADLEDRIQTEMALNKISRSEALVQLKKNDHERREWSLRLYGVDTCDPGLYDQDPSYP